MHHVMSDVIIIILLQQTAQRSAEEQLQTLRGQAEVKAEMCKTDSKMVNSDKQTD